MNPNIDNALQQAFDLIETGDLDGAKSLLKPILEAEKDNADVWWVYSHAVSDVDTARLALNNVLRIEPNYPDARTLLSQLDSQQKSESIDDLLDIDKDPAFLPPMPASIPGITSTAASRTEFDGRNRGGDEDDLPDSILDEMEPEPFYRRPVFYVPVISLLLIGALAIVIIKPFAVNSPAPQAPVSTAQSSSRETPTIESIGHPTETLPTPVTADSTGLSDFSAIKAAFADFALPSGNDIEVVDTSAGKTLSVNVCTSAGKQMRELLPKAMETLAAASNGIENTAQTVAVKLIDCTSNATLLWIGTSAQDAAMFASGALDSKGFQAKWQPLG